LTNTERKWVWRVLGIVVVLGFLFVKLVLDWDMFTIFWIAVLLVAIVVLFAVLWGVGSFFEDVWREGREEYRRRNRNRRRW
jgi:hypothetical protein